MKKYSAIFLLVALVCLVTNIPAAQGFSYSRQAWKRVLEVWTNSFSIIFQLWKKIFLYMNQWYRGNERSVLLRLSGINIKLEKSLLFHEKVLYKLLTREWQWLREFHELFFPHKNMQHAKRGEFEIVNKNSPTMVQTSHLKTYVSFFSLFVIKKTKCEKIILKNNMTIEANCMKRHCSLSKA